MHSMEERWRHLALQEVEKCKRVLSHLMSGFVRVPFDNINAIQEIASKKNKISALFVEPIQGEGGVNIPDDFESYLRELRDICNKNNWLLIFDEVQCGVGRTGKWFAYQNSSIKPDVVTLS